MFSSESNNCLEWWGFEFKLPLCDQAIQDERDYRARRPSLQRHQNQSLSIPTVSSTLTKQMDIERQSSIANAFKRFREIVEEHSRSQLRNLIEVTEAISLPVSYSASLVNRTHLDIFLNELNESLPQSAHAATRPRDLLAESIMSDLVKDLYLDGVSPDPPNLQAKKDWFDIIQASIVEQGVQADEFPPPDLKYLSTLVNAVFGPGLPLYRKSAQFDLLCEVGYWQSREDISKRAIIPSQDEDEPDDFKEAWEDWGIKVACLIGDGPSSGGTFVLFCRSEQERGWRWRYGFLDEGSGSEMFDTVEEFLHYFATEHQEPEDRYRKIYLNQKAV